MNRKVLVTGATGFVGKELCRTLIENGYEVVGAVRSPEKLSLLVGKMEFKIVSDIGPRTEWSLLLDGVDKIIYLAARAHVMHEGSNNPLTEYRKINTEGAEKLAIAAAKKGVRRMVYLSTIKVNGEVTGNKPFTEHSISSSMDSYAKSKWEAEQILQRISEKEGVEVVVIRPPLIYGDGVGGNFLRLLNWVDRGIPLPLGSINNRRSLIYVRNLVDAILVCMEQPRAAGETFLVSDGQDISTADLVRMIASSMAKKSKLMSFSPTLLRVLGRLTGKSPEVERLTGSLCIDMTNIRKTIGWKPPFGMEEGIHETVRWYQANKEQRFA